MEVLVGKSVLLFFISFGLYVFKRFKERFILQIEQIKFLKKEK